MTNAEYIEQLGRIQEALPDHPLLSLLLEGHSRLNEIYLASALREVPEAAKVAANVELKKAYTRKSVLFGQRARLSNKMCALAEGRNFDRQRAAYSEEIQALQREIESVMRLIQRLEAGELPADTSASSGDRAAMLLKRNSLRSSLSRKRKQLAATQDKAKRAKIEATINQLIQNLTDVESALQTPPD